MVRAQPFGDRHRKRKLTERRQAVLDFVGEYGECHGYPPSLREIGSEVGLKSTSAVSHQLDVLEKMGLLTRDARRARAAVVKLSRPRGDEVKSDKVEQAPVGIGSQNMVSIPLFERIAAGTPVAANRDPEGTLQLPREQVGSGDLFAVKVVGDSMVNANIFDGDIVVVRHQNNADNGDIVAALIEEEATVKTFHRMNGRVLLLPQSPTHEPIPGDNCLIMGKVVTTIHRH
jgi:repressor LexA